MVGWVSGECPYPVDKLRLSGMPQGFTPARTGAYSTGISVD